MVWKRERVEYHGKVYDFPLPPDQGTGLGKPLKSILEATPGIPIYCASFTPAGLAASAEVADGVFPVWVSPEQIGLIGTVSQIAGMAVQYLWGHQSDRLMRRIVAEHTGPLYILYRVYEEWHAETTLTDYRLESDPATCITFVPGIEPQQEHDFYFCKVKKIEK